MDDKPTGGNLFNDLRNRGNECKTGSITWPCACASMLIPGDRGVNSVGHPDAVDRAVAGGGGGGKMSRRNGRPGI